MSALALLGGPRAIPAGSPRGDERPAPLREALIALAADPARALCGLTGAGPIADLEARFRAHLGPGHVLAVSSGTAALHAALAGCGIGAGDEVIVSAYDWGAATAAALAVGAVPVFVDVDPATYTLDPAAAAAAVGLRTAAIIATHLFGHPAGMHALCGLARARRLCVIEDCAQAWGAAYRGCPVGAWGDAAAFSLGWGKALSAGEGGVVVFRRADGYARAVQFCQHPLRQVREGVEVNPFGLNYRMHPLAAAIALHGWDDAASAVAERRRTAAALSEALSASGRIRPAVVAPGCEHAMHRYSPTYVGEAWDGLPRGLVVQALAAEGVPIADSAVGRPVYAYSAIGNRAVRVTPAR